MPPRTQPNIYFVAFDMKILQMGGKSVRMMRTAQSRAFPPDRFTLHPVSSSSGTPRSCPAQCRIAFLQSRYPGPPSLGGSSAPGGHGGGGMQGGRKPGVSPPNTENTKKTPFSFKNPSKNKKAIFNFIKEPFGRCLMCCNIHKMRVSIL